MLRTTIPAVAFSTDSDFATFSTAEQTAIKRIWQRVAEDYAPFDVDVTPVGRFGRISVTSTKRATGSVDPRPRSAVDVFTGPAGTRERRRA